jgi:hypothetical protein
VWGLYDHAARALGIPVALGVTVDNVNMNDVLDLFRAVPNYTIITLDEYHMLLSSLSPQDKQLVATQLRYVLLDSDSPCQFTVTGSTGAALISSLEQSGQNGISLFRGACIVNTDYQSSSSDLADVDTLLAHHNRAPASSPAEAIESKLGYVNCAAENIVSGTSIDC